MPKPVPAGMLTLPLLLFGGTLAFLAAATRVPRHESRGRVELELAGVLPLPEGPAGILVLREKGKDTILPVLVPDGRSFAPGARGGSLLGRAIEALGGQVAEVEITRAEETASGARVRLTQAGKPLELTAVPSESIALAVSAGVPIVTSRHLMDEEGLTPEDLARAHPQKPGQKATRL